MYHQQLNNTVLLLDTHTLLVIAEEQLHLALLL